MNNLLRWQKEMLRRKAIAAARRQAEAIQETQESNSAQRIKDTAIYNEKLRGLAG